MRIAQLDLKAFGHFTDRRIVFGEGADFHIAYGPNEAGKTTISRALRAALFGVPERTTDNHLHANPNLRVGVVLASSGGEQLAAMRRKARKNSIVRYDPATGEEMGEAIPDERLLAWMGGLTEGLYTSMFGLDHDELVAGGKALSEGKGELGQSLFEAGAGLSSVRQLRERLAREADGLFRPRASSSHIYKVLDQYGEARREAREAQIRPAEWEQLRSVAEGARAAYDGARRQQEALQREVRRLERLAAVLPDVAAREFALARLADLGGVVRLPADAPARRIAAEARLRQAEGVHGEARDNIARLGEELAAIVLPPAVLDEAGSIEALYYALDAFRSAREVMASANGRMAQAGDRVRSLLAAIGESMGGDLRSLIPGATLRARVQSLITRGATLQAELAAASGLAATTRRELGNLNDEIGELGPRHVPASVAEVLHALETDGNPEPKADELKGQAANLEAALVREASVLAAGTMGALVAMGTPLPAQLQRFRAARDELETRKYALRDKIENIENDIAAVNGELEGLLLQGDVLTAEDLAGQRGLRDSLWAKIRCRVFPRPDGAGGEETLPTAAEYEFAVQSADNTADSRFADAARVSRHADLLKRLAQMRNAMALEQGRLEAAALEADALQVQWQALLAKYGLPDLGIAEAADWLARRDLFMQRHQALVAARSQAAAVEGCAAKLRADLSAALSAAGLPACGESEAIAQAAARLRGFVGQANKAHASQQILARKKKGAEDQLLDAENRIAECRTSLEAWRAGWTESMAAIRLAGDAGGEEATARLGQFEALEDALDTVDGARAELAAARETVQRVDNELARLCHAAGYERGSRPADAVVETLYERLCEARELARRSRTLQDLIQEAGKAGAQADAAFRMAEQELSRLKVAAGCETLADLVEAESRSGECQRLEGEVAAIEARLVAASALPLHDLLAQAAGQDLALVQASLERAGGDLNACTAQVEALHGDLIAAEAALDKVDGEAVAAAAEQQAADAAARLSNLIAEYASARLASTILAEVIDTYQQRYQGPLLARASELFAAITGGRFLKVAADFDEDMSILVGVRANGRRETVGNLSSGTRDQLFLALRLAAIESHVLNQEPMPVVVDDIVINFDDAATSATFKVLADLSRKTQVLFFTHHEHLLERAADAVGEGGFTAHRL